MGIVDVKPGDIAARIREDDEKRRKAIWSAVVEATHLGLEVIIKDAPKDTKELVRSGHVVLTNTGTEIVFDAPHAVVVELGSRPHMPPLEPLVEWVKRHATKLGIGKAPTFRYSKKEGPPTRKRMARYLERFADWEGEVVKVAQAIRYKIARDGTRPTHFVRSKLPKLARILRELIAVRIGR